MEAPPKIIGCLLLCIYFALPAIAQQGKMYSALEITIYPMPTNANFSKKHPVTFLLVAKNNLITAQEGIIVYEIKNAGEEILQTGKMKLLVSAGKTFKQNFKINFSQPGNYRIDFDIIFPDYSEKQTGKIIYQ